MSSIPLPALSIRPPQQQENPLQQYGQLMQLKNEMANQPLQRQALQQQVQSGGLQLEQQQQAQKDQQAFRQVFSDPSMKGKTISDIADYLAQKGQISQQSYQAAKKADIEQRQSLATLDKDQLANADAAHKATQQIYDSVMDMPDEQFAQNWPQIAQQYDSIPGNNKAPLDPSKPLTKQQLQQFGPMIAMQRTYLDEAAAKKKKEVDLQKATAETSLAETNAAAGGTTDQAKVEHAYLQANHLPDTPENRLKAFNYFNDKTKIAPAEVRAQIMLQTPTQVFNPETGQNTYATRKDAIGQIAPSSGEAVAAKAGVQADAASLKKLQTSYDNVTAFENTAGKNLDQFLKTAKNVIDSGSPMLNTPLRLINSRMGGSADQAAFNAARQTAVAEIGKVLNSANAGSGVVSDSARHEVEGLIGPDATLKQIYAASNILKKDMENRKTSYQDQIHEVRTRLQGGSHEQNSETSGPAVGSTKKFPNGKTGVWDGHGYVAQ